MISTPHRCTRFTPVAQLMCRALVACLPFGMGLQAAEWPEFRGPDGQGHAQVTSLPVQWSEGEHIAWRAELPGKGWSSPVIEGDTIWLTASEEQSATAEQIAQRTAGNTGDQPLVVAGKVTLRALGVDRSSGQLKSNLELMVDDHPQPIHSLNSFASPTPVIRDGRLYCHFGSSGTACVDTREEKVVWVNHDLRVNHENGAGSSPVLWKDMLIVHCDGSDQQYIAALDARSGKLAWKTDRSGEMSPHPQMKKSYGTPLVVEIAGQPVLISPASNWLYAYDPYSGRELWKIAYGELGFSVVPRPVFGHGMLYFSTGFMQPELIAVRLQPNKPEIAWRYKRQMTTQPSPLLVGDQLYVVSDKGIFTSLNALTGELVYSERLGGNFSSSPLFAAGRIYVSNREGSTFVIQPGTEYRLLATNTLDGQIMASPAALDNTLYIRTDRALYAIR